MKKYNDDINILIAQQVSKYDKLLWIGAVHNQPFRGHKCDLVVSTIFTILGQKNRQFGETI